MCLIVFAYKSHPEYKLILLSNRDEFYERPTASACWWDDFPILAGRDLKAGGTWIGLTRNGRFASVTNFRDLSNYKNNIPSSRGDLTISFLKSQHTPTAHCSSLVGKTYNGYNLLVFDDEMAHFSNYENKVNLLQPGIYGLSNALLDTPWPKVEKTKNVFSKIIQEHFSVDNLLTIMRDTELAEDETLPNTGLTLEMERVLSAVFIRTPKYGTCCSTVLTIGYNRKVEFIEKNYPVGNRKDETRSYSFMIER